MRAFFAAALLMLCTSISSHAATLSGQVLDLDGVGIQNVSISMTGSLTRIAVTDVTGAYSFTSVPLGGNYTLTPSKSGLTFTPVLRATTTLSDDWTGLDFTFGKVWSGAGLNALASNPANWTANIAPITGDVVRFDGTSASKGCFWDLTTRMDTIQLQVDYASSVVAGVDVTVGNVVVSGGELLIGSHEIHISKNFQQTTGRFRSSTGGTAFFEGTVIQTITMTPNSLGSGLYDSFFNGFRVASSSWVRLGSGVVADGTFNISSGRFDMQSSTLTLTGGTQSGLGGSFNWDDTGGRLVAGSGAVAFDSRAGASYQIRQDPTNTFKNLIIAGSSVLTTLSTLQVTGNTTVAQVDGNPKLNLANGFRHTFARAVFIGPTADPTVPALTVGSSSAVFQGGLIVGTATVSMLGGDFLITQSSLQVNAQGQLLFTAGGRFVFWEKTNFSMTSGSLLTVLGFAVFMSSAPGVTHFSTDINGTLDIQSLCQFNSMNADGLQLEAGAQPVHLNNLSFGFGITGGAAINFNPASTHATLTSPSFDATISTNVRAVVDVAVNPSPSVDVVLATGPRGNFTYEYDPSNIVHWGVLGTPSNFEGTTLGISSITWSWTIVNHPLGFYVMSSTGGVMSPTLDGGTTTWTEVDLDTNTAYSRFVRAFTDVGQADSSVNTRFTAANPVSNAAFREVVVSSVTLIWDINNPSNTIFEVDRSTDNVIFTQVARGLYADIEPHKDIGLIPEKHYYYRIKTENGDGVTSIGDVSLSTVTLPVPPPTVFSVSPSSGPNLGVMTILVHGFHIQNNAALRIKRSISTIIEATDVSVIDENTIQGTIALTGAFATPWDVEIENPDAKLSVGSGQGAFTVFDAPSNSNITTGSFDITVPLSLPTTDDKTLLDLNAGALPSSRLYISVDPQSTPLAISPSVITNATAALRDWIFIPGTLREILAFTPTQRYIDGFNAPVRLGISFPDADHDGIIDSVKMRRVTLRMMTLNENSGQWELLNGSSIDIPNNRVVASLNHFSVYALFGSPAAADLSQAKVYPSPWKPGSKTLFNATHLTFTDLTESGDIRIFNSGGHLVHQLSFSPNDAGVTTWDGLDDNGKPISSGIYIVNIKSSSGTSVTIKFGVER